MRTKSSPAGADRCLRPLTSALLSALLAGAAIASAPPSLANSDDAVSIQRTYHKGDVDRYRVLFHTASSTDVSGADRAVDFSGMLKETTSETRDDGSATIVYDFERAIVKLGDNALDAMQFLTQITATHDKFGAVITSKPAVESHSALAPTLDFSQLLANAERGFFPGRPVRIGETWPVEGKESIKEGNVTVKGQATLVAIENIGDTKTYRIKSVTDTALDLGKQQVQAETGKGHFDIVGNVDVATGKLIKMAGSVDATLPSLGRAKFVLDISLTVPGDKQAAAPK
jgi:hypothetical protein